MAESNGTVPTASNCKDGQFSLIDMLEHSVPESDFETPDYSFGRSNGHITVREQITYIVCGVVLRGEADNLEVLMVQEAKDSCRGKWYLPAGRLERGEKIDVATKREVKEESGYDVELQELIYTEIQGNGWYRVSFACEITGGSLKTTEEADEESIQADWFKVDDVLAKPPVNIQLRFSVLMSRDLVAGTKDLTIPIIEFSLIASTVAGVLSRFLRDLMSTSSCLQLPPTVCLGVQCRPQPPNRPGRDGLCLSILVLVRRDVKAELVKPDHYVWTTIKDERDIRYLRDSLQSGAKLALL